MLVAFCFLTIARQQWIDVHVSRGGGMEIFVAIGGAGEVRVCVAVASFHALGIRGIVVGVC